MKRFFLYSFIISCFSLSLLSPALAVGIAAKPTEINLEVKLNQKIETEILIANIAKEPAIYQIYPDALEEMIILSPKEFTLEPGANQIIKLEVRAKRGGLFATNISAVARPMAGGGFSAASGIKIPITISVSGIPWVQLIFALAFFTCLAIVIVLKLKKSRKSKTFKLNFLK